MHSKSDETSQNETVKNDREPVGLMPDSDQFISRLESKLKRISSKNPNRVTGKDLIKNMAEFKEIYMTDYLKDTSKFSTSEQAFNQDDFNSSELNSTDKNSFLESKLLPTNQSVTLQESQVLLDNDWLSKKQEDQIIENN